MHGASRRGDVTLWPVPNLGGPAPRRPRICPSAAVRFSSPRCPHSCKLAELPAVEVTPGLVPGGRLAVAARPSLGPPDPASEA